MAKKYQNKNHKNNKQLKPSTYILIIMLLVQVYFNIVTPTGGALLKGGSADYDIASYYILKKVYHVGEEIQPGVTYSDTNTLLMEETLESGSSSQTITLNDEPFSLGSKIYMAYGIELLELEAMQLTQEAIEESLSKDKLMREIKEISYIVDVFGISHDH